MERSQTETIARENGYKKERDNQPLADKWFDSNFFTYVESGHPNNKVVGCYRFKHNGKRGREADYDTKSQNEGKDGYFILQNTITGELKKSYFQEKFLSSPLFQTNKYCYETFEIVDNCKYSGWGCHLVDVEYLIFYHPDRIVVMENIGGLVEACNNLYDEWKKTSIYEPQTLTIPELGGQKTYISKYDDPKDTDKWKVTTPMSNWVWDILWLKL